MYRLTMVIANIKHNSWWWNGKRIYTFETIDELIDLCKQLNPPSKPISIPPHPEKSDNTLMRSSFTKIVWCFEVCAIYKIMF